MSNVIFAELEFWLTVLVSVILPVCIYAVLLRKRSIARNTVLILGLSLVVIAGIDVYLLQSLARASRATPSLADDAVFLSEVAWALYMLPVLFGGVGINVISHVLIQHLVEAERRFDQEHQRQ